MALQFNSLCGVFYIALTKEMTSTLFPLCIMIHTPHDIYLTNILYIYISVSYRILLMIYNTMYHDILCIIIYYI